MIQTSIAKFFLLSQALSLMLGINGFILKNDNNREKRDLVNLLNGSASLVSASEVNPLDVIPIPLKMNLTRDQRNFFADEDDENENVEEILGQFAPIESGINFDNIDQKLNDLRTMYETAISNLRTETVGAQTYIQKKTSLAEQHLENILKSVELMVNNRVDLSFHSIETKMNEAQKLLNALNGLILKNLESKLKLMEGDLFNQVKKEKLELEEKMNQFSEKVEILSEKLTQLVSGRYNANRIKFENETDSANETTVEPTTTDVPLFISTNESVQLESLTTESTLEEQTESVYQQQEINENSEEEEETDDETSDDEQALEEETNDNFEEEVSEDEHLAPVENEVVLNAWGQPHFYNEYPEYEEYLVPNSEFMIDYYNGGHPVRYEYQDEYY